MGDYHLTSSVSKMISILKWPSLEQRRLYSRVTMFYNLLNYLGTPSNLITRGQTKNLFKYRTNSYVRSNFYSNRVINDWNSLPQSIVDSPSVNELKYRWTDFTVII